MTSLSDLIGCMYKKSFIVLVHRNQSLCKRGSSMLYITKGKT